MKCVLCQTSADIFFEIGGRAYYRCGECCAIFLDPACFLSRDDERKRYLEHNNDVEDPGYQEFVRPIVSAVEKRFSRGSLGLDFGAGTGPVAAKLLQDKGYVIKLYDPYFWNDPDVLQEKYDFVFCCEVIEHFNDPAKEFERLRSLLNPGGALFCMTELYSQDTDFKNWYYKNDPTHVCFYHQKTCAWIASRFLFSSFRSDGRLIQFNS